MPNLELSTNELLMLKELLENDMEQTSQAGNADRKSTRLNSSH